MLISENNNQNIAIRIENIHDKLGIWRSRGNSPELNPYTEICIKYSFYTELRKKFSNFPTPKEDFGIPIKTEEYCAFTSIEQLKEWIEDSWLKEMFDFGFKVYKLVLSDCKKGEQVIFKKENIIIKEDITEQFKQT